MPLTWISDPGSHFKNEVMATLATMTKRLNRDLLQVLRVLLREYRLAIDQWDYLLPVVFTLLKPTVPLHVILGPDNSIRDKCDWSKATITNNVDALRLSLHEMHKKILDLNREREARKLLDTKRVHTLNVEVGEYVLWSRVDDIRYPKLRVTWLGPYLVIQVNEFSVKIQHLITKEERLAHSSRIKYYSDSSLNVTEDIIDHVSEQGVMLKVAAIAAHRNNQAAKLYELHVHWEGLEAIEASWKRLYSLLAQCPTVVQRYVESLADGPDQRRLRSGIALS
ncbi:hypothetical protein SDRG_16714 [Saprolegnia diclina VS20]|uniref:Chromo domain-containing protein n=1 Tax=Saprolegnia diclina (strain VS20) TaxID=1156394 RepID=T0PJ59_SAPDV|nr:hypothetical protein SDRG_16714 [Saprolegnia diclina VS20]EQC25414.1 hypothetical protein SDRG_16714 [Saprolegnia diclina VS20]|eukprot:XP_008621154.1 hypothetical protein SDRG_16714 [Saprolegnia diclina VS20]